MNEPITLRALDEVVRDHVDGDIRVAKIAFELRQRIEREQEQERDQAHSNKVILKAGLPAMAVALLVVAAGQIYVHYAHGPDISVSAGLGVGFLVFLALVSKVDDEESEAASPVAVVDIDDLPPLDPDTQKKYDQLREHQLNEMKRAEPVVAPKA